MKVVLSKGPMFEVSREVLNYLWENHRELFDEPIDPQEVMTPGSPKSFEEWFTWAVLREGQAYFLSLYNENLRTLPWLVTRVERGDETQNQLYVVEIQDHRKWSLFVEEDGSDWIVYEKPVSARP